MSPRTAVLRIGLGSKLFVPLAKLKNTASVGGIHRVDIHARTTRDGRTVCIDSSHEKLGRQIYLIPIGHILDNASHR